MHFYEPEPAGTGNVIWRLRTKEYRRTAAQTRTETEEAQSVETTDSKNQDQTTADKTQDQDVAQDEANGFALRFTEALLKQKKEGENLIASPYSAWLPLAALVNGCSGETQNSC